MTFEKPVCGQGFLWQTSCEQVSAVEGKARSRLRRHRLWTTLGVTALQAPAPVLLGHEGPRGRSTTTKHWVDPLRRSQGDSLRRSAGVSIRDRDVFEAIFSGGVFDCNSCSCASRDYLGHGDVEDHLTPEIAKEFRSETSKPATSCLLRVVDSRRSMYVDLGT